MSCFLKQTEMLKLTLAGSKEKWELQILIVTYTVMCLYMYVDAYVLYVQYFGL